MFRSLANRRPATAGPCCLLFLTFLSAAASAQQFVTATPANAKQFVGVWRGDFHGNPFVTVKIGFDGDKIVGSLSHADIQVNEAGELTKAEAGDGADPISDASVNGDVLRITIKSADGSEESFRAELKLVANNEATFQPLVPPDVPAPKPWRLQRVSVKP